MAVVNRLLLWLCLLLSCIQVHAQTESWQDMDGTKEVRSEQLSVGSQIQIINQAQIENSGYSQLSDLFQLLENWTYSTYTGNKWLLQANGSSTYFSQNWQLMVNGVRVDLMSWDAKNINALGFSVHDLERIEVINGQGMYLGEFNDKGIIHFITKKLESEWVIRAMVSNGVEIGDPHLNVVNTPWLNVHGLGSTYGQYVGYQKKRWQVESSFQFVNYFYRDTSQYIRNYIHTIYEDVPHGNVLLNGRSTISYKGNRTFHQVVFHSNRGEDIITPVDLEKPIVIFERSNGAAYVFKMNLQRGELGGRLGATRRDVTDEVVDYHNHRYQSGNAILNFRFKQREHQRCRMLDLGLSMESLRILPVESHSTPPLAQTFVRPYMTYVYDLSKSSKLFADVAMGVHEKGFLPRMAIRLNRKKDDRYQWSAVLAYSQRVAAENNDYLFYLSQLKLLHVPQDQFSLKSFDYYGDFKWNNHLIIKLNTGFKAYNNSFGFLTTQGLADPIIGNNTLVLRDEQHLVNQIGLYYKMENRVDWALNYLNSNDLSSVKFLQRSVPTHRFSTTATLQLPARLSIWVRYYYQSQTSWQNPDWVVKGDFSGSLPQYLPLGNVNFFDFGVNKRLLADHLTINLTLRNVFNQKEQYQLFGAAFYHRLLLFVKWNLEGLPQSSRE